MLSQNLPHAQKIDQLPGAPGEKSRLFGLDWLRAISAILVVALHAAIPYMSQPLPGLRWSILPVDQSEIVNMIGWGIDAFIMPIFFLMNGYLAARTLQHRGAKAFLRHRLTRIGGPFLFGLLIILPMDLYIWLLGWVSADLVPFKTFRTIKIGGELGKSLHGVSHLWFLEYVLVYCASAALLSHLKQRFFSKRSEESAAAAVDRFPRTSRLPLVIGIAVAGSMLWLQPRIVIGFRHGWAPFWENLVFYAVPFMLGWYWDRHSPVTLPQGRRWVLQLGIACLAALVLWPELVHHLQHETTPVARARMPFLFATVSVLMSTGLFGGALWLRLRSVPRSIAYLSKASFWIYLVHHPIVALLQVDLLPIPIPAFLKFSIALTLTVAICLLTYEGLVRTTALGTLINGVREERNPRRVEDPEIIPIPAEPIAA